MALVENNNDFTATPNVLFCPSLLNNIVYLYSQFPAWIDCLRPLYKSPLKAATFAASEEYFKDLKNNLMQNSINANKFVLGHLKSIQGQVKLAKAAVKRLTITNINHPIQRNNKNTLPITKKLKTEINSLKID